MVEGKVAVVTGGGSGIGQACAITLAECGASVVVADIVLECAQDVVTAITDAGGHAVAVHCDVTLQEHTEHMVEVALREFGRLDIAVNNAGIAADKVPLEELPIADWFTVMEVNLDGVFLSMKAEIPAMLATGGGSIVNISSIFGSVASAKRAPYIAAKHAVVGLTKAAALDYAKDGIRVNAVAPGFIDTPLVRSRRSDADYRALEGWHPLGRLGTADEVAQLVTFLASDSASNITGSYQLVDGCYTAQ